MSVHVEPLRVRVRIITIGTIGPFSQLYRRTYDELKRECFQSGQLFVDPDFPANNSSLGLSGDSNRYKWLRPLEICDQAQFMTDGISRFDVKQGILGDCWLAAGLGSICDNQSLLKQVVPLNQSMTEDYAGIFHFNFWQYGEWREVIIDDRLPTIDGQLAFIKSTDRREFWTALLEKAYAKIHGSYGALEGGHPVEAMEDFTGGVCEWFQLNGQHSSDIAAIIRKALDRSSLISCCIEAEGANAREFELPNGLLQDHAYTVNLIYTMPLVDGTTVTLVRLRNPWGNDKEWKLAWSDGSSEWSMVSESEKEKLELRRSADGEFWMSIDDFVTCFEKLEICNLGPDALTEEMAEKTGKHWEMAKYEDCWIKNVTAGGCPNNWQTSFFSNPQYRIHVQLPDEDSDKGTVVIALMQKKLRTIKRTTSKFATIGFALFKLPDANAGRLTAQNTSSELMKYKSEYINRREVSHRYKLKPGYYCVIPSTFYSNVQRDFILRIYSERKFSSSVLDEFTSLIQNLPHSGQRADDNVSDVSSTSSEAESVNGSSSEYEEHSEESGSFPVVSRVKDTEVMCAASSLHSLLNDKDDDDMIIKGGATEAVTILADSLKRPYKEYLDKKREIASFRELSDFDMEIDAYQLCDILTEAYHSDFDFDKFRLDVCKSMVAMLDDDKSGKLSLNEFRKLCQYLRKWVRVFKDYDADQKGFVQSFQLREVLKTVGYTVSNQTFHTLVVRYGDPDGRLHFQDFVHCLVRLSKAFDVFNESAVAGSIILDLDQFIQTTTYN